MAAVTAEHVAEDTRDLAAAVNGLRADFASFKGSVEKELQLTRTLGKFVAGFMVAIVASAFGLAWQAGALSAEVKLNAVQLEKRMDRLEVAVEKRIEKVEARIDRLEAKIDTRFDAIMQRLDQVVFKPKP